MITKRIDKLTYADIERLVLEEREPEGLTLDYKRDLPGKTSEKTTEFLKDVSSFANGSGGHLVFGVTTKRDEGVNTNIPDEIVGVDILNEEQEKLRLEQMIRDGIQHRLVTFTVKPMSAAGKPSIIVIYIARSWNAPHMVGRVSSAFYTRTSAGRHALDVTELRHAFAMSESISERIKAFRDERIGRILAGETPAEITPGAVCVLHIVPLDAFSRDVIVETPLLFERAGNISPTAGGNCQRSANFDGVLIAAHPRRMSSGYIQLYRNGIVEIVDTWIVRNYEAEDSEKKIRSLVLELEIIKLLGKVFAEIVAMAVPEPYVVFVSLLNCRGYVLLTPSHDHLVLSDRDHLLMPSVFVENASVDMHTLLQPIFDRLWQGFGALRCTHYDETGKWSMVS